MTTHSNRLLVAGFAACLWAGGALAQDARLVRLDGYAEWRRGDFVIVEGQRVRVSASTKWQGGPTSLAAIPLGSEVKVRGVRAADGAVIAQGIETHPNGDAMFEGDLKKAFDERERYYVERGRMYDAAEGNSRGHDYGRLLDEGREVERARTIAQSLVPQSMNAQAFRVYVVDNKEWNAMAA